MQVQTAMRLVAAIDKATEEEGGCGFVAKALCAVLVVIFLVSAPVVQMRAHTVASQMSFAGMPAWVTYEFLKEALEIQQECGIYASVTIAQAQQEVGGTWDGTSLYRTAAVEHNYFGLKAAGTGDTWNGEVTWDGTPGATGTYRRYASVRQGLRDRARLLLGSGYYTEVAATAYGKGTSDAQAQALSASPWCEGGYASLGRIMDAYNLRILDDMTAADLKAFADGGAAVARARSMIGKATYVWGACDAAACQFDCSGFVAWCLTGKSERLGTTDTFVTWRPALIPQPGDVCCFTGPQYPGGGHCGIYIGVQDGVAMMIDCSNGVAVRPVDPKMRYYRYG